MKNIEIKKVKYADKTVIMEDIYSMEYYRKKDGSLNQVLKGINLTCNTSEIWSVIGDSEFELKLLLEIIANTKPYQKGKCVLVETGMMRKKRVIVPHTFYIGNKGMLFNNMKVLEYLMFVTSQWDMDVIDRQEGLLNLLIELGLANISLSDIYRLRSEEKAIVMLLVAVLSESGLIIFNLPDLDFNDEDIISIQRIVNIIKEKEKTLIFSTKNYNLANKISTNVLVLDEGEVIYSGEKDAFINKYDNVVFRIVSDNPEKTLSELKDNIKEFTYRLDENVIEVFNYNKVNNVEKVIYDGLAKSNISINFIEKNKRNIRNSYREVVKKNDIQQ